LNISYSSDSQKDRIENELYILARSAEEDSSHTAKLRNISSLTMDLLDIEDEVFNGDISVDTLDAASLRKTRNSASLLSKVLGDLQRESEYFLAYIKEGRGVNGGVKVQRLAV
jgi:hypothetical protein